MNAIYFLVPTLVTIVVSMLIVRAGAIALAMTGMNFDKAKFQALSAFSGTGFTTREAERVVNNPRRRKIVSWLMVFGNAGIVTVIVTATSSFARAKGVEIGLNLLALLGGLGLIYLLVKNTPLIHRWEQFAQSRLARMEIFEDNLAVDELLHLSEGYGVARIQLLANSAEIGKTVYDVRAGLGNVYILGIENGKEWTPVPERDRVLIEGDSLVIYGKLDEFAKEFD